MTQTPPQSQEEAVREHELDELFKEMAHDHFLGNTYLTKAEEELAKWYISEYSQRLLAWREAYATEARINELTLLDNSTDEVTPEHFHKYYIDRIAQLKTKDGTQ